MARERLGDERTLLHPARERSHLSVSAGRETDALDRVGDDRTVAATHRPDEATSRESPRGDDLAHRRRRISAELRALREVPEDPAAREPVRRFAEEERVSLRRALEPEHDPDERRLPSAVRPRDGDELPLGDLERDVLENALPRPVAERDVRQLDRYRQPSASLSAARLRRMSVK